MEKIFNLSIQSDLGDSVVSSGTVGVNYYTKYFSSVEKALDFIREEVRIFLDEHEKDPFLEV